MAYLRRVLGGGARLSRIEALSDGVFAVVVALLVLELRVPLLGDPGGKGALLEGLRDMTPRFLGWLLGVVVVCKFWLNHGRLLGGVESADGALAWLNALFLAGQAFLPFPAALLGRYPDNGLAVAAFGIAIAADALLFIALQAHVARRLPASGPAGPSARRPNLRTLLFALAYLIGAAAGWHFTPAGFALYAVAPLLPVVPPDEPREPQLR